MCRVCAEPADSPNGTYCATHRPLGADNAPRARDVRATPDAVVDQLQANLEMQLTMAAQLWSIRDEVCGSVLVQTAPNIAEYWANQARKSPGIARALEMATTGGGVLAGLAVHAPLIMVVMEHHVRPALERRREQLAGEAVVVGTSPASPAPPPGPRADTPAGTAPDPAAEAAAAWTDPDAVEVPAEVFDAFREHYAGGYVDPFAPDSDGYLAAESGHQVMAQEAAAGLAFGQATDNGTPAWEAPGGAGPG